MKKYPIVFTTNFLSLEKYAKDGDVFSAALLTGREGGLNMCRKWEGKEISLLELEELIEEFELVVFDGRTIEIYNDYRE